MRRLAASVLTLIMILTMLSPSVVLAQPVQQEAPYGVVMPDTKFASPVGDLSKSTATHEDMPEDTIVLLSENMTPDPGNVPALYLRDSVFRSAKAFYQVSNYAVGYTLHSKVVIPEGEQGSYQFITMHARYKDDVGLAAVWDPIPNGTIVRPQSLKARLSAYKINGKYITENGQLANTNPYYIGYTTQYEKVAALGNLSAASADAFIRPLGAGATMHWGYSPIVHLDAGVHDLTIETQAGGDLVEVVLLTKTQGFDWTTIMPDAMPLAGTADSRARFATTLEPFSDIVKPVFPQNADCEVVSVAETTAQIQWDAATDDKLVVGYEVIVSKDGRILKKEFSSDTIKVIEGLNPGETYTYEINGYDKGGSSTDITLTGSFDTTGDPDTVPPVWSDGAFIIATAGDMSIALAWDGEATDDWNFSHYEFVLVDNVTGQPKYYTDFNLNDKAYTIKNLDPNKTYTVKLTAVDVAGNRSELSDEATTTDWFFKVYSYENGIFSPSGWLVGETRNGDATGALNSNGQKVGIRAPSAGTCTVEFVIPADGTYYFSHNFLEMQTTAARTGSWVVQTGVSASPSFTIPILTTAHTHLWDPSAYTVWASTPWRWITPQAYQFKAGKHTAVFNASSTNARNGGFFITNQASINGSNFHYDTRSAQRPYLVTEHLAPINTQHPVWKNKNVLGQRDEVVSTKATLNWEHAYIPNSAATVQYKVYSSTNELLGTTTDNSFEVFGLAEGAGYTFYIEVTNGLQGTQSEKLTAEVSALMEDTEAPQWGAGSALTTTAGIRSVTVSLSDPATDDSGEFAYRLEVQGLGNSSYSQTFNHISKSMSEYTVTGLQRNTEYEFTLYAFDSVGNESTPLTVTGSSSNFYMQTFGLDQTTKIDASSGMIWAAASDYHLNGPMNNTSLLGWGANGNAGNMLDVFFYIPEPGDYYVSYSFLGAKDETRTPGLFFDDSVTAQVNPANTYSPSITYQSGSTDWTARVWSWLIPQKVTFSTAGQHKVRLKGVSGNSLSFRYGGFLITNKADLAANTMPYLNITSPINAQDFLAPSNSTFPVWGANPSLSIERDDETHVTLSWTPATMTAGTVYYNIYNKGTGELLHTTQYTKATLPLSESITREYEVEAITGSKNVLGTRLSAMIVAEGDDVIPPVWDAGVLTLTVSGTAISASWPVATDDISDTVLYQVTIKDADVTYGVYNTFDTSMSFKGLEAGNAYTIEVVAKDDAWNESETLTGTETISVFSKAFFTDYDKATYNNMIVNGTFNKVTDALNSPFSTPGVFTGVGSVPNTNTFVASVMIPEDGEYYISYNFFDSNGTRSPDLLFSDPSVSWGGWAKAHEMTVRETSDPAWKTFQWLAPRMVTLKKGLNTITVTKGDSTFFEWQDTASFRFGGLFISSAEFDRNDLTQQAIADTVAPNFNVVSQWGDQNFTINKKTQRVVELNWEPAVYNPAVTLPLYTIYNNATNEVLGVTYQTSLDIELPYTNAKVDYTFRLEVSNGFGGKNGTTFTKAYTAQISYQPKWPLHNATANFNDPNALIAAQAHPLPGFTIFMDNLSFDNLLTAGIAAEPGPFVDAENYGQIKNDNTTVQSTFVVPAGKAGYYQVATMVLKTKDGVLSAADPRITGDFGPALPHVTNRQLAPMFDGKYIQFDGSLSTSTSPAYFKAGTTIMYGWGTGYLPEEGARWYNKADLSTVNRTFWDWSPAVYLEEGEHSYGLRIEGGGRHLFSFITKVDGENEADMGYDWTRIIPDAILFSTAGVYSQTYKDIYNAVILPNLVDRQAPVLTGDLTIDSDDTAITVSWPAATDDVMVAGYNVTVKNVGTEMNQYVAATSATFTGLAEATDYEISVTAIDTHANESETLTGEATTTGTPDDEAPVWEPSDLLTVTGGRNALSMQWPAATDNKDVSSYTVVVEENESGALLEKTGITDLSYTMVNLVAGKAYTVTIYAYDFAGNVSEPLVGTGDTLEDFFEAFFVSDDSVVNNIHSMTEGYTREANTGAFGTNTTATKFRGFLNSGVIDRQMDIKVMIPESGIYYISYNFRCHDGSRSPILKINGSSDLWGGIAQTGEFTPTATFDNNTLYQWIKPRAVYLEEGVNTITVTNSGGGNTIYYRFGGLYITNIDSFATADYNVDYTFLSERLATNVNKYPQWSDEIGFTVQPVDTETVRLAWNRAVGTTETGLPVYEIFNKNTGLSYGSTLSNSMDISDLANGDYEFVIKVSNGFGGYNPTSAEASISLFDISCDSKSVDAQGAVFTSIYNLSGTTKTIILGAVAYDEDGRMIEYRTAFKILIPGQTIDSITVEFLDDYSGTNNTYEAFIWEGSLSSMKPLY